MSIDHLSPGIFIAERSLTPRRPYLSAPLSYLNAWNLSWSLWAGIDRLESVPNERGGRLEFFFHNVVPGTTALVTLYLTVGSTGAGVKGTFEVRSSAALPRQFPVTGFRDHTVDVIVHPSDPGVLVTLDPGAGVGYLSFQRAEYQTL